MKPVVNSVHIAAQAYRAPAEKAEERLPGAAGAQEGMQARRAQSAAVRVDISQEAVQAAKRSAEAIRQTGPRSFAELAALEAAEKTQGTAPAAPVSAKAPEQTAMPASASSASASGPQERPRLGRIIDVTV